MVIRWILNEYTKRRVEDGSNIYGSQTLNGIGTERTNMRGNLQLKLSSKWFDNKS